MRPPVSDAADVAGMRAACLLGADPDHDLDAGLGHAPVAGARHLRVWIGHRRDDRARCRRR